MSFFRSTPGMVLVLLLLLGAGLLAGWLAGGGRVDFGMISTPITQLTEPRPGRCLVLEEKYCQKAEPAYYKNDQLVMIGFRLPAGTPVFAPFAGTLANSSVPLISGGTEQIHQALSVFSDEAMFFGGFDRPLYSLTILVAEGQTVTGAPDQPVGQGAVVTRIPHSNATLLGKYNLLLAFGRFSPDIKMFANDLDRVKSNFGL